MLRRLKIKFYGNEEYLILISSVLLLILSFIFKTNSYEIQENMRVVSILAAIGIYNPPKWLVWTLVGAGSISFVVGTLTTFGLATVPAWAAKALLAADGFSL